MRSLDDCKAEIFRRSDERIKKRKKTQKQVITLCVPLCICVCVLSVVMLPSVFDDSLYKTGSTAPIEKDSVNSEIAYEKSKQYSFGMPFIKAEISAESGFSSTITDSDKIADIYMDINDLYEDAMIENWVDTHEGKLNKSEKLVNEGQSPTKNATEDAIFSAEDSNSGKITIRITQEDGSETVYTLNSNRLTNNTTEDEKNTVCLSDKQLTKLKEKIGILK